MVIGQIELECSNYMYSSTVAPSGGDLQQRKEHNSFLHETMHTRADFHDDQSNIALILRLSIYKYILQRHLVEIYSKGDSIKTFFMK